MTYHLTPDLIPLLSRGKHRNPRKGACFMEMASYLAGERWSDHPKCTHPLLAALARDVNDRAGDAARQQLAPMIPEVIGLDGDDPRADARIALAAACAALPIASADRQRVAAVGVMRCERQLNSLEGRPLDHISVSSTSALKDVPHAKEWAEHFVQAGYGRPGTFARRAAPYIVHSAVAGISTACVEDRDAIMVDLLRRVISNCHDWFGTAASGSAVREGRRQSHVVFSGLVPGRR